MTMPASAVTAAKTMIDNSFGMNVSIECASRSASPAEVRCERSHRRPSWNPSLTAITMHQAGQKVPGCVGRIASGLVA